MKSVVLENEDHLDSSSFISYLGENQMERTYIYNADQVNTDEILAAFSINEVLEFKPTMITFSQYNLMMMVMYKLLAAGILTIKEIHIFSHNEELESELKELWSGKTKYLEAVTRHVKIYQVGRDSKKELTLI
jgi:hypothetical protein